jgi:predicted NAD/FAD-dependent oxidoreductase
MKSIAIIGAGFSAATLSYFVKKDLDFYEKSRGVGGRCSTRRVEEVGLFDHGLQYIKNSNSEFKKMLNDYSIWQGNFKIYVGTDMVKKIDPTILKGIVSQIPVGRLAEPEEIAALASYLVSDKAGFITGATFSINGGQYMQ